MTPKLKAEELVLRYSKINARHKDSIKCALIAINEMINICYDHHMASYYGEVKQEIEKL